MVMPRPAVLTRIAVTGGNMIPLARYKTDKGITTVKLFIAKSKSKTKAAKTAFSGVYSSIVSTVILLKRILLS
ncbi:MAG: hypothetical protein UH963_12330 [Agathobacter sp.]|nr:hypothetical protein [Agathobacter sp.]